MTKANSLVLLLALALLTFVAAHEQGSDSQAIKVVNNGDLAHPRDFARNKKRYADDDEDDDDDDEDDEDDDDEDDDDQDKDDEGDDDEHDEENCQEESHQHGDTKSNVNLWRKNRKLEGQISSINSRMSVASKSLAAKTTVVTRVSTKTTTYGTSTQTSTSLTVATVSVPGGSSKDIEAYLSYSREAASAASAIQSLASVIRNIGTTTSTTTMGETTTVTLNTEFTNTVTATSTSTLNNYLRTILYTTTKRNPDPTYDKDDGSCRYASGAYSGNVNLITKVGDPPMTVDRCYNYCLTNYYFKDRTSWWFGLINENPTAAKGEVAQSCMCSYNSQKTNGTGCKNNYGKATSPYSQWQYHAYVHIKDSKLP